jgi:hypothetical protein
MRRQSQSRRGDGEGSRKTKAEQRMEHGASLSKARYLTWTTKLVERAPGGMFCSVQLSFYQLPVIFPMLKQCVHLSNLAIQVDKCQLPEDSSNHLESTLST